MGEPLIKEAKLNLFCAIFTDSVALLGGKKSSHNFIFASHNGTLLIICD